MRTLEEVSRTADAAGLRGSVGGVQLLHFSLDLHSEDIRLVELEKPVLSALRNGEKVVIRGLPSDDAVLCTQEKTFDLRVADTSNTLLIAPGLKFPTHTEGVSTADGDSEENAPLRSCEVTAYLGNYLELRACRPKVTRLKALLAECPFRGAEFEEEIGGGGRIGEESQELLDGSDGVHSMEVVVREGGVSRGNRKAGKRTPKKYTFEELLDLVQSSEDELYEALDKLQACPIQGYWRLLDADYRDMAFQHVMRLLVEQDWSYKHVPLNATCRLLQELEPEFAIKHCVSCYGNQVEEGFQEGEVYYELSEARVCQFYAELLLRPAGKFNYQEFLDSWQASIPEGMVTSLDYLKGLALVNLSATPPTIWHYSAADLPQEPSERFLQLFRVRDKWSFEEIEPYIKDLETPKQSLNALLMKFARVSTDTVRATKLYSSKRTS